MGDYEYAKRQSSREACRKESEEVMERDYATGVRDDVRFFIGHEVEHTPAFGMKTLFVVGLNTTDSIESVLADSFTNVQDPVKHIFFGANHSYNPARNGDWDPWEGMIIHFLKKDYLCSLDIPLSAVEGFNDGGLNEYNNFIPQIRVPIPYIRLWNYNTTVKIDDKDFKATNPGVWSHSLHKLMDRSCFTDWKKYGNDTAL